MDQYTATYRQNAARSSTESSSEFQTGTGRRGLMARTFSTMNTETLKAQRRQRRNERSKAVANQGLFYAGTFALVWVFGTIVRAMQLANATPPWILIFWFAVMTPSQGFFNFLVYIRPRLIKYLEKRKKKREKRSSKNGSSFNSDILHVSGMSGASSSHEVSAEIDNRDRDNSTKSDLDLTDPFARSKEPAAPPKVRFAATDVHIAKVKPHESASKVRFETSKVRFVNEENNSDNQELGEDTQIKAVDTTSSNASNGGRRKVELSKDFELKKQDSEETIDPALLSASITTDDEDDKIELPLRKKAGSKRVELHNATIDFATGEVRTRSGPMRVSP